MLNTMDNPPTILLTKKWHNGVWLADIKWVGLMPRDKAALILEAFDIPNEHLFLVLADWMDDHGEDPKEIQRFRDGNWHEQDYAHATVSMFWKAIQEFRHCPSTKVFIRLLKAHEKHEKFLEWYSKTFNTQQSGLYQIMKKPELFEICFGETARKKLKWGWPKSSEEDFKEKCDYAKEICYYLRKKEDLKAWCELWKDRRFFTIQPLSNWQKSYNPANKL